MNNFFALTFFAILPLLSMSQEFTRNTFDYESLESENFPECDEKTILNLENSFVAISQNNSAAAVENAKNVYDVNKNCPQVFEVYGFSLFRNGKWFEGLEIIEEGIRKFGSVPELIKRKSKMSLEMAQLGVGRKNIDGSTVYKANSLDYDEDQFILENFTSALADLNYLMINYQRSEEIFYVAKINQILERYEESNKVFEYLLDDEDYSFDATFNLADNYISQNKLTEAENELNKLFTIHPRMGIILEKLSELYEKMEDPVLAQEYEKKAVFYSNVPDFLEIEYSEANFELLVLFGTDESSGEDKRKKLEEIYDDGNNEFTIDICLIILKLHANHGNGLEEKASEILGKIGQPSIEKVNKLFQEDVATCTITNLAGVMATVKDEKSWELMKNYLPYIANMPMTMIPPNLPEKMVQFDQKRGVTEILLTVQPLLTKKKSEDGPMAELSGFGQYVYYVPLKEIKQSKLIKTAKKLGYTDEEIELLKKKLD